MTPEIMAKAERLMADIGIKGDGQMIPHFHFNTKLAHCLTGWVKLAKENPDAELHYRVWCGLAADFVASLPKDPVTSGKTGEVMDPMRAARGVFPPNEKASHQDLYEIALSMHDCARMAGGGDRKKHYGINQDHLNLVEMAAELKLIPVEKVRIMTRRCLGKDQTTAEANQEFSAFIRGADIAARKTEPTFTLIDDTPGHRVGVLKMAGINGSDCRFPVAFIDTAREHLVIAIEPRDAQGTSVTNMAEKIISTLTTKAKHLRHPAQAVRFFEVYEDRVDEGKFDETYLKEGHAVWKPGDMAISGKIMAAVRHACGVAAAEKPVEQKKPLAQTLQTVQEHGFKLTVPAPIVTSPARGGIDR